MTAHHYFTNILTLNVGSPAFEALKQAPAGSRQDQTAAVYYVTLHIDGTNAHRLEEDMANLKFAFDGFGEANLHRVDEVGTIATPGYIVAIPNDGKTPLMGALENRVTIQKLPKDSHSQVVESEGEAEVAEKPDKPKTKKKRRGQSLIYEPRGEDEDEDVLVVPPKKKPGRKKKNNVAAGRAAGRSKKKNGGDDDDYED